jgi:hypothetical protein
MPAKEAADKSCPRLHNAHQAMSGQHPFEETKVLESTGWAETREVSVTIKVSLYIMVVLIYALKHWFAVVPPHLELTW